MASSSRSRTAEVEEDVETILASGLVTPTRRGWKGTIAVDMDDVLCQTNATIVHMHNELFDTQPPLTLADFKNYLYWMNRGWGTPEETVDMVAQLYQGGLYMRAPPVPGAKEALHRLKDLGYNLVIITARSENQRAGTEDWIAEYLPDIFDEIHFTGAFQHLEPTREEKEGHVARKAVVSHHKRSKAEIIHSTSSLFLIDDSSENAYDVATSTYPHDGPIKVLLFGDYPWNAVVHGDPSFPKSAVEGMTYHEKVKNGLLEEYESIRKKKLEKKWLPPGVERAGDWEKVLGWVERFDSDKQRSQAEVKGGDAEGI
ncbi:uncharacterized protein I303_104240 [Kwoniella dejecticola CBS 10117]|uniref:Uncharacterized protein n=1 Tax=Kwoniella dejecticola CBS 10117 TaxID=1296121 RepID=A0A1A6A5W8_9TREE|nr:uncharacterized protein I303_04784 [Kwoniella dejecticola CBS 10117]OBR85448.1 hypothetical protein I303_04784 [Kwoniella dejecticola CBS 10117]